MLRNYLHVFLRNLLLQKTVSAINIFGLALGLCVFMLISLYVKDQYSYESRWQHAARTVRLLNTLAFNGSSKFVMGGASALALPQLKEYFPAEIETGARAWQRAQVMKVGNDTFQNGLLLVDPDFIRIFDFDVVQGSLDYTLAAPNRVALNEDSAGSMFKGNAGLGSIITLQVPNVGDVDYEVTAIYRVPPGKGRLQFNNFSLLDESALPEAKEQFATWFGGASMSSFFLLRPGVNVAELNQRLPAFVEQQVKLQYPVPQGSSLTEFFRFDVQAIRDIYFHPVSGEEGGSQTTVNSFAVIAILVLLIALTNFVILAVARSVERQREVGIRKAAGVNQWQLIAQFIGEAVILTFIALLLALALLELTLPYFAALMQTTLVFNYQDVLTAAMLPVLVLVTGGLGGFYPALVLARLHPAVALKPGSANGRLGRSGLRNLLVGFQFSIAIALIIATAVLYLQLRYVRQRDPGFVPDHVVSVALFDKQAQSKAEALRTAIAALPGVEQVAVASRQANSLLGVSIFLNLRREVGQGPDLDMSGYHIDYDFFPIYGMHLLAGRLFDRALDTEIKRADPAPDHKDPPPPLGHVVLNATAVRALGFADPAQAVGAIIQARDERPDKSVRYNPIEIIGVVADSQFASLRAKPGNEAYSLITASPWFVTARVSAAGMQSIRGDLERLWRDIFGYGDPYIGFAAENVKQEFKREANEASLLIGFAGLAIAVSCMGLYGLVAFEGRRRTKEIGIRKVLGGDALMILLLLLRQFARPVFWANLLAWPLAVGAMLQWLQRFPYQIAHWWLLLVCIGAALLVLVITGLTVSLTVANVIKAKPVLALRYE